MLIHGARVFNVYRRRFEVRSVLVRDGLFAAVSAEIAVPPGELRLDAAGAYLVPGLVDIHMHIESSMTTPAEFSRAALPRGTTTVVADPHEIANVFGPEGIRAFMAQKTDIDIFYGLPSSVPSTNAELETTGGKIGSAEISELAADDRVVCLGEVMNAAELVAPGDTPTKRLLGAFRAAKPYAPIEGHCPRISGAELSAFIASGVWADHTQQTAASILEKVDAGMFIELQRKSITEENIRAVVDNGLYERVCLVTDDVMPDHLVDGHLDRVVALAIERGLSPEDAVYLATHTPSRHMGLRDRGAVAPGRIADFILLDDLAGFRIRAVYKRGKLVPEAGAQPTEAARGGQVSGAAFPPHFYASVRRAPLSAEDFAARPPARYDADAAGGEIDCVAVAIDPKSNFTDRALVRCGVREGLVDWKSAGLCLAAAVERYGRGAPVRPVFVKGALTGEGAVATTWAHDHHNLLVLGSNEADMAAAANAVIAEQGGYLVVRGGAVVANAPLPVGGIVSEAPIAELAESIRSVREAMRELGYAHVNEIMSFSTLSLLVSPRLKISDKGLVDVKAQTLVENYEFPYR